MNKLHFKFCCSSNALTTIAAALCTAKMFNCTSQQTNPPAVSFFKCNAHCFVGICDDMTSITREVHRNSTLDVERVVVLQHTQQAFSNSLYAVGECCSKQREVGIQCVCPSASQCSVFPQPRSEFEAAYVVPRCYNQLANRQEPWKISDSWCLAEGKTRRRRQRRFTATG